MKPAFIKHISRKAYLTAAAGCVLAVSILSSPQNALADVQGTANSAASDAAWAKRAFTPSSTTLTPAQGSWKKVSGKWKFQTKKGVYLKSAFYKIEKSWYHFDAKGFVSTGWFTVGKSKYYAYKQAAANGVYGELASGWRVIGKKTYYFSKTDQKGKYGALNIGWKKIGKKIYYFQKKGAMATGLTTIGKSNFYFLPEGAPNTKGSMVTGWYTVGDQKYYFRPSGKMGVKGKRLQSVWATINNQKFYFNASGQISETNASREAFIKKLGKLARADMKKSGVLASVTVAQAILESGYGTSSLALEANNLFGMKAALSGNNWSSAWKGATFAKKTPEYLNGKWVTITDTFRAYASYAESVADHSAYLTGAKKADGTLRYKGLKGCKKYKTAAKIIKNGGYATAPTYVTRLCQIIKQYNLTKYDK